VTLSLNLVFGGPLVILGLALLLFLTPFVWLMLTRADVTSPFLFRGEIRQASGRVSAVRDTNARVNRRDVYEVEYEFAAEDGARRRAVSYLDGTAPAVGTGVAVEYPAGRPDVSRIVGGRRALFGMGVLVILLFFFVPLGMLYFSVRSGARARRLLRDGALAKARFLGSSETNTSVNDRPVMRLRYAFNGPDGLEREVSHNSSTPGELTDDKHEQLLYLPDRPEVTKLVDALPGSVVADENGELGNSGSGWKASLVLALLTLLSHGACAVLRFAR
jgi:hypothetical protein